MIVPEEPTPQVKGGSPAFWFGVQTQMGDGALIQPIMAKWIQDTEYPSGKQRRGFFMFQEIYDYTDEKDEGSSQIPIQPGDLITASVHYSKGGPGLGR
jgi:hypothetical protein